MNNNTRIVKIFRFVLFILILTSTNLFSENQYWIEKEGVIYGSQLLTNDNQLITNKNLYATGDYIVDDANSLIQSLTMAKKNNVIYISENLVINRACWNMC